MKNKLDEMEKLKLICKVTISTKWVNPMLAVEKAGGDVQISLDPLDLIKKSYPNITLSRRRKSYSQVLATESIPRCWTRHLAFC